MVGALSISSRLYLGRFIWQTKSERSIEEAAGYLVHRALSNLWGVGWGGASRSRQRPWGSGGCREPVRTALSPARRQREKSLSFTPEGRAGLGACDRGLVPQDHPARK